MNGKASLIRLPPSRRTSSTHAQRLSRAIYLSEIDGGDGIHAGYPSPQRVLLVPLAVRFPFLLCVR